MKLSRVIALVFALATFAMAGQSPASPPKQQGGRNTADQQEVQALSQDVTRMRVLLNQLEMNLAMVQTSQTPLKHQFDLEIEMWRITLDGMERRLQRLRPSGSGVALPETVPLRQGPKQGRP